MTTLKDLILNGRCNRARCLPDAFIDDIIDMMARFNESAITVVAESGEIAGILTDHDVMRAIKCKGTAGHSICGEQIKDWMTTQRCHLPGHADPASPHGASWQRRKFII